jgi:hypothetical protein
MINTQFGLDAADATCVLDYDQDIAEAIREIDEDATEVHFPNGVVLPLSAFEGRTAAQDAEVDTEAEYDDLPVSYAAFR